MNAPTDDITMFLGAIPEGEYEQRKRIRSLRNAAAWKVRETSSRDARTYCWIVTEVATSWIYAPASLGALTEVATYLRRLITLANQAETLEATWESEGL
jgi:hypothetical protein